MIGKPLLRNIGLLVFGVVFGLILSNVTHSSTTNTSVAEHGQQLSVPAEKDTSQRTQGTTTVFAREQMGQFRILELTFSYPKKADAVWII